MIEYVSVAQAWLTFNLLNIGEDEDGGGEDSGGDGWIPPGWIYLWFYWSVFTSVQVRITAHVLNFVYFIKLKYLLFFHIVKFTF